jgi:D-tyrosyl-tRNA(Tyr) deacylase
MGPFRAGCLRSPRINPEPHCPGSRVIGLLQRVSSARVEIEGHEVAAIGRGLLVLVGFQRGDEERMNLSLRDIGGDLMLVPQFTLAADTGRGMRASFASAAPAQDGRRLFDYLIQRASREHPRVQTGVFGADMRVSLTNEGPVTFWLET